jgi:transketolase
MNVMTPQISQGLDQPITTALRALAMDAVENAKSGHPGAPMGLAEVAGVLWRHHLCAKSYTERRVPAERLAKYG